MRIRRLFWLGAAVLFSIAALVAIAAVLGGDFGDTQARILATCGIAFVCGGAALAGFACLDRGVIREAAWATIVFGVASFVAWTGAAWQKDPGKAYWKLAGVLGIWTLAGLLVTTLRLIASSPRLLATVVPATWGAVGLAALLSTEMVLGEDGGPWQVVLVLVILTGLGYALTPALQRFWADSDAPAAAERLLGTLGNIDVFAVRGEGRSVTIGSSRTRLASSEGIVLRERS
ncbi:MAG TPA: hypothetical protein VFU30_07680 [Gaiellaceae bacterium]|nr:hypothetical protein [Gaiellaceae bacterium]